MTNCRDLDAEISEAERQWIEDHPNGISAEEEASMARYAFDACRDEGCRDDDPQASANSAQRVEEETR